MPRRSELSYSNDRPAKLPYRLLPDGSRGAAVFRWLAVVIACALVFSAAPARGAGRDGLSPAQRRDRARAHFAAGKALVDAHDYPSALREFQNGYRLEPLPLFLFNMAQAARLDGKDRLALEYYERFLATEPKGLARRETERRIGELRAAIASAAPAEPEPPPPPAETAEGGTTPAPPAAEAPTPPAPAERVAAPATEAAKPPARTPAYRKWWVWTVSILAIAGAGVGLGLGLWLGLSPKFQPTLPDLVLSEGLEIRW